MELIWIDEFSAIKPEVFKRLRKACESANISIVEVQKAFENSLASAIDYTDLIKRLDRMRVHERISNKKTHSYDTFLPESIGRQRRK